MRTTRSERASRDVLSPGGQQGEALYIFVTGLKGTVRGQGLQPIWFVAKACSKASTTGSASPNYCQQ